MIGKVKPVLLDTEKPKRSQRELAPTVLQTD